LQAKQPKAFSGKGMWVPKILMSLERDRFRRLGISGWELWQRCQKALKGMDNRRRGRVSREIPTPGVKKL
jgi:hypothetical protein